MSDYSPFFDQEGPQIEVYDMVASDDKSEPYELDACAVFIGFGSGGAICWLVVGVSGCSCWPDRGSTSQDVCYSKADVARSLSGGPYSTLLDDCQAAGWGEK